MGMRNEEDEGRSTKRSEKGKQVQMKDKRDGKDREEREERRATVIQKTSTKCEKQLGDVRVRQRWKIML